MTLVLPGWRRLNVTRINKWSGLGVTTGFGADRVWVKLYQTKMPLHCFILIFFGDNIFPMKLTSNAK